MNAKRRAVDNIRVLLTILRTASKGIMYAYDLGSARWDASVLALYDDQVVPSGTLAYFTAVSRGAGWLLKKLTRRTRRSWWI